MALFLAVVLGVAAAVAYGSATAVQHDVAHTGSARADARGLLRLLREPRWLLAAGGDTGGLVLQVLALAAGPVVLVQPLLVLTLPVALAVGALLGGPRPVRADYAACAAILAALTVFFLVVGEPPAAQPLAPTAATVTLAVLVGAGALLVLATRAAGPARRAGVLGAVAGVWFGTAGVLVDASVVEFADHGAAGLFTTAAGLVPLVGTAVVGALGMALTQASFQIGALAAGLPANESAAPVAAVVLGSVLLHEHVPTGSGRLLVYGLCLAAVVAGTIRLAAPRGPAAPVRHNGRR